MAYNDAYARQVALLIRVLPFVAEETVFALKGGTAINLFVRDMPRLSVDIDLTYLPVQPRDASLAAINAAMARMDGRIQAGLRGARITQRILTLEKIIGKLDVELDGARIKIEVTPVSRGCVYPPTVMQVANHVEEAFGFAETQVVSFPDLYASKIVAALDRQHPRDLFDVRDLLANEGVSDDLRAAFVAFEVVARIAALEVARQIGLDLQTGRQRAIRVDDGGVDPVRRDIGPVQILIHPPVVIGVGLAAQARIACRNRQALDRGASAQVQLQPLNLDRLALDVVDAVGRCGSGTGPGPTRTRNRSPRPRTVRASPPAPVPDCPRPPD